MRLIDDRVPAIMSAILSEPVLSFRPMQEADLTDVIEIERRSYPYPWTRTIFSDCLRAGYSCWVCERQGIIEGYGVISVAAGESHLLNLCVRPEALQQGIGRKLLKHFVSVARRH
ncbi:MAG: GNAT family N-acetyltransferase, partial [Gammaproteobacteria bacterium]|nr:GNAT family N-acetyltransferase [Gammaproteobacteria bacterium]